jgi:hypothetical protein
MAQVYLIARRAEVQNGSVMVTDLFPNESQRNTAIDPVGAGPIYVRQIDLGVKGKYRAILSTTANVITFARESRGLVAFLIKNVASGANGDALTVAEATIGANLLLDEVRDGDALTAALVNGILDGATIGGAGTDLTANSSISELMRVLSGETYIVKAGSTVEAANGNFVPDVNASAGFQNDVRHPVDGDSSWVLSAQEGVLSGLKSNQNVKVGFAGVLTTDPIVTVYNADGSLFV